MSYNSFVFSIWFSLVSLRQNFKWTKLHQQKPYRAIISFSGKKTSVKSRLLQQCAQHFTHFMIFMFFSAVGLYSLPTYWEGRLVTAPGQPLIHVSVKANCLLFVYKGVLSLSCTVQLATEAGLVQNLQFFLQLGRIEIRSHSYQKRTVPESFCDWNKTTSSNKQVSVRRSAPEFDYCVHTHSNDPHQGGKMNQSSIQPNETRQVWQHPEVQTFTASDYGKNAQSSIHSLLLYCSPLGLT